MVHVPFRLSMWQARVWWAVGLMLVLTACRGNPATHVADSAPLDQTNAQDVHAALLTALQANDREQVMALTVDDQQAARAETWLRMVQAYMQSTATEGPYATGGELSRVEIIGIEHHGAASVGRSRWVYPQKTVCHIAELAQTGQGWRVTSFHTTPEACAREN